MTDTPSTKPNSTVTPTLEREKQEAEQTTQQQTEQLKAPAEASVETRSNLKNLEESISLLTPERLAKLDAEYTTQIQSINLAKLPENTETEKQQHVQNLIVSAVGLSMKVLKNSPTTELEDPTKLFSLQLIAKDYTPLERATFEQLKKIFGRTGIDPELHTLIFGDWKNDIALLRKKVYPENATKAEADKEKEKSESESGISGVIGQIGDAISKAGSGVAGALGENGKVIGTVGATAGLVFLLYKLIPKDENKSFFSFGKIMSLAAASLGGLFGFSMLKNMDYKSLFSSIGTFFGGAPANAAETDATDEKSNDDQENKEAEPKGKKIPLKDALGTYKKDLEVELSGLKSALRVHQTSLSTLGAYLGATNISTIAGFAASSSTTGISSLIGLSKLGFTTATGHPLAAFFATSAFLMHLEEMDPGKFMVYEDPKDMAKQIKEHINKNQEFFSQHGIEMPSSEDIEMSIELIKDKKKLKEALGKAPQMVDGLFKGTVDKLKTDTTELVAKKNDMGLDVFHQKILGFGRDKENTSSYFAATEAVKLVASKKEKISPADIDKLINDINGLKIGIFMYRQDGYVKYDYVEKTVYLQREVKVCIDPNPAIKEKDLKVLATNFVTENTASAALGAIGDNVVFEGINKLATGGDNLVNAFKGVTSKETYVEKVVELAKSGYQLMVIDGGSVVLASATSRYILGPVSTVQWLFSELPKGEVHEYMLRYNEGIVPVLLVTLAGVTFNNLIFFRHRTKGWQKVAPFAKALTYPISGMYDIVKLGARPAIMMANGTTFKDIGIDPFAQLRATLDANIYGLKRHGFAGKSNIKKAYADISDLSKAHDLALASRGQLFRENIGIFKGASEDLKKAEGFLRETNIGSRILNEFKGLEKVDQESLKTWLKVLPDIINQQKASLPHLKALALLEKQLAAATKANDATLVSSLEKKIAPIELKVKELEDALYIKVKAINAGGKAPKNAAAEAAEAAKKTPESLSKQLEDLRKASEAPGIKDIDSINKQIAEVEEAIQKQAARITNSANLTETQKKSIVDRINGYSENLNKYKVAAFSKIKGAFDKLPKGAAKNELVAKVNSVVDGTKSKFKHVDLGPGGKRLTSFAVQFAVMLTVQKGVEVAADPYHDFEKALAGVASWDTAQLMLDLVPGLGFTSNFISAATGKELLTGEETSRLAMLGWGVVNLGQDVLGLVPFVGTGGRVAVFMAKLAKLVESGKISGKLLNVMKKFPALAKADPQKAWAALWRGVQANEKSLRIATHVGAVGMMAATLGPLAYSLYNGRDVELAQADKL